MISVILSWVFVVFVEKSLKVYLLVCFVEIEGLFGWFLVKSCMDKVVCVNCGELIYMYRLGKLFYLRDRQKDRVFC